MIPEIADQVVPFSIITTAPNGPLLLYHSQSIFDYQMGNFSIDKNISEHAVNQSIIRQIGVQELREAIANGEIIEEYPDDKYGPSCLMPGFTSERRRDTAKCIG